MPARRAISTLFFMRRRPGSGGGADGPATTYAAPSPIPAGLKGSLDLPTVVTALAMTFIVVLSIRNHFIQDDGFITLRYVDNFLRGHGPVWYPGSQEFGYTNFLFMLLVTGISLTGLDPITSATIVTYVSFYVGAVTTFLIVRRLTDGNTIVAALAMAVAFGNFTVASYASGLLETSLQIALVALTYYFVLAFTAQTTRARFLYLATAAATLGLLTRLDTVLLIAPVFLYLFFRIAKDDSGAQRANIRHMVMAMACSAAILSAFLVFCQMFYGQILPNTFYAKAGTNFAFGLFYMFKFFTQELLIYPCLAAIAVFHFHRTEGRLPRFAELGAYGIVLAITAVLWTGYVFKVGGGFMGFRLMVPFIVIFYILLLAAIGRRFGTALAAQLAVIAMLSQAGQYLWYSRLDVSREYTIETPVVLNLHITRPKLNWRIVGDQLNALFNNDRPSDVTIALTAAGVMGYYSRLPVFDIHGLNTREVALNGLVLSDRPGHRKSATLEQMEEGGVNLIVTTRYVCHRDARTLAHLDLPWRKYWPGLAGVLIPVSSDGCWIVAYYVSPHPDVEYWIDRETLVRIDPT